jgi:hypothetical protein
MHTHCLAQDNFLHLITLTSHIKNINYLVYIYIYIYIFHVPYLSAKSQEYFVQFHNSTVNLLVDLKNMNINHHRNTIINNLFTAMKCKSKKVTLELTIL